MNRRRVAPWTHVALCLAAAFLLLPPAAGAQDSLTRGNSELAAVSSTPNLYGTTAETAYEVYAWDFSVFQGTGAVTSLQGERRCATTSCAFFAGLRLPAGALVSHIELKGCDGSAVNQVQFAFFRRATPEAGAATPLTGGFGGTGTTETPGCNFYTRNLVVPETINNVSNTYFLDVLGNVDVDFMTVRVYYKLQVSPAPAVATFTDVPTDNQFYREVEALVAAGITNGQGPGIYGVNNPVTRGQMAAFLARALGLHFAP